MNDNLNNTNPIQGNNNPQVQPLNNTINIAEPITMTNSQNIEEVTISQQPVQPQNNVNENKSSKNNKIIIIILILIGIGIFIINFLKLDNSNKEDKPTKVEKVLLENVTINSHMCIGTKCDLKVTHQNKTDNYSYESNNTDIIKVLNDYEEYIKININYIEKTEKIIVDYEIFIKETNENISDVRTEKELIKKLGLYEEGTHVETLRLIRIGYPGFGIKDNEEYSYISYIFEDERHKEYEMKYINSNNNYKTDLIEGKRYKVTFEVIEESLDYEFYIKEIN